MTWTMDMSFVFGDFRGPPVTTKSHRFWKVQWRQSSDKTSCLHRVDSEYEDVSKYSENQHVHGRAN